MIRANSAADAEEMDQLKSQLREYDECLAQMQQVNKELKAINHEMEKLMSETIAPEVKKLSEESVAAIEKLQQENTDKLEELDSVTLPSWRNLSRAPRHWMNCRSIWMRS